MIMKRLFFAFLVFFAALAAQAQLPANGYYRVMNYKTERYAYLCDRTGELNYTTQNADVSAIQLWKDLSRALDDPASVLYAKSMGGDKVDLQAQGTGLYHSLRTA